MNFKIIWISILFLLCSIFTLAQEMAIKDDYHTKFNNITTKQGLSDNHILDIIQDKSGFIWIATKNGLNRFDAYDFLVFKNDPTDATTLSSNVVSCVVEDHEGNIWVGTIFGLNKYDRKKDKFIRYFYDRTDPNSIRNNHIRALLADDNGILWVETMEGYLHKMNIETEEIDYYKHGDVHQEYYHYHDILKENDSILWLGGRNMDVHRFNIKSKEFKLFRSAHNEKNSNKRTNDVSSYFLDSQKQLWVTGLDGAYTLNPKNGEFHKFLRGSTFTIYEDKNGALWFGTGTGIYKFNADENTMTYIRQEDNNPHSLCNNNVNKIIEDKSGVIWVATDNGLSLYSPKKDNFTHYFHIPGQENTISGKYITDFTEDKDGNLWIATAANGLNKLNLETGNITKYKKKNGLMSNHLNKLYFDKEGHLWIATWSGLGFQKLNTQKEVFSNYTIDKSSTNIDWHNGFLEDDNGDIQLAVWGGYGLYTVIKKTKQIRSTGNEVRVIPNDINITSMDNYKDSILWLGGVDGELNAFLFGQQKQVHYKNIKYSESDYSVIKKMQEYNYEMADIPAFRSIVDITSNNQRTYFTTENGAFYYDHINQVFLKGSLDDIPKDLKGDLSIKGKKVIFKNSKNELEGLLLPEEAIGFVVEFPHLYWISAHQAYKTNLTEKTTEELIDKTLPKLTPNSYQLTDIVLVKKALYIGSNKGLFRHPFSSSITYFVRKEERSLMGYPVHLLNCFAQDIDNTVWLGTTATGLAKWSPTNNTLINIKSNELDSTAFWGKDVNCIFKDKSNQIWIGSHGLNLYNRQSNSFSHYTKNNGLAHNEVKGIAEDLKGRLWITTKNGLSCFSKPEQNFTNYYESQGLPSNELTSAILCLKNGQLVVGTKTGFALFHPDSLVKNNYIPPVLITKLQIQDNQVFRGLSQIDTVYVAPNDNKLSFHFSSLDYNSPEQNAYKYKLEGLDENWTTTDAKNRVISYSNLHHGSYTFKLKGSNNNDVWNEYGKSLHIVIHPHYYQSWWFYAIIVLLVAFIVWMIILYRVRELKLEHKAAQLEQRFLRAQMNPHFIFNSLGAIQSFIFKNEPLEAATYLSNFSELVRLILDNSRQDLIPLDTEVKTLSHYLDLQLLRFGEKFEYELEVDEELKNTNMLIPPMLAQPFIENSIEHAFAGMKEKGKLRLCFRYNEDGIQLICEDNGMGIEASLKQKKEKQKEHKSLATKITRERIIVLNNMYKEKVDLDIIDLKKTNTNLSGTRVVFSVPNSICRKLKKQ